MHLATSPSRQPPTLSTDQAKTFALQQRQLCGVWFGACNQPRRAVRPNCRSDIQTSDPRQVLDVRVPLTRVPSIGTHASPRPIRHLTVRNNFTRSGAWFAWYRAILVFLLWSAPLLAHLPMTTVLPVAGIGMSIFLNMCRGISCVHCSHRRSGCWREDQQNGWPVGRPSHTKPKSRDCHAACIP